MASILELPLTRSGSETEQCIVHRKVSKNICIQRKKQQENMHM